MDLLMTGYTQLRDPSGEMMLEAAVICWSCHDSPVSSPHKTRVPARFEPENTM